MPTRLVGFSLVFAMSAWVQGGEPQAPSATLASPFGTVLVRSGGPKPFLIPSYKHAVPLDTELMTLPGLRGLVDLSKGAVRLHLIGNLPELSPGPALESVVVLHAPQGADLDFTLVRGKVLLENRQDKRPAKVKVRLGSKEVHFELQSPGGMAMVEHAAYWPDGSPFLKKPDKNRMPIQENHFILLKGDAEVSLDGEKQTLQGPVLYRWSGDPLATVTGPVVLKKLPAWAVAAPVTSPQVQALQKAGEKIRRLLEKDEGALTKAITSDDPDVRTLAALAAAGLDDPGLAIAILQKDAAAQVRGAAAKALRSYQGRGSAEDVRVFERITKLGLKPGPATILMELLHGIPASARDRPETYDALISYLQHDQQAIRHLAGEQLTRLAPRGKDIAFDAAGPAAQRAQAQAAWRKLIPDGQVAPK